MRQESVRGVSRSAAVETRQFSLSEVIRELIALLGSDRPSNAIAHRAKNRHSSLNATKPLAQT
jgi:hypothetical protein